MYVGPEMVDEQGHRRNRHFWRQVTIKEVGEVTTLRKPRSTKGRNFNSQLEHQRRHAQSIERWRIQGQAYTIMQTLFAEVDESSHSDAIVDGDFDFVGRAEALDYVLGECEADYLQGEWEWEYLDWWRSYTTSGTSIDDMMDDLFDPWWEEQERQYQELVVRPQLLLLILY